MCFFIAIWPVDVWMGHFSRGRVTFQGLAPCKCFDLQMPSKNHVENRQALIIIYLCSKQLQQHSHKCHIRRNLLDSILMQLELILFFKWIKGQPVNRVYLQLRPQYIVLFNLLWKILSLMDPSLISLLGLWEIHDWGVFLIWFKWSAGACICVLLCYQDSTSLIQSP